MAVVYEFCACLYGIFYHPFGIFYIVVGFVSFNQAFDYFYCLVDGGFGNLYLAEAAHYAFAAG